MGVRFSNQMLPDLIQPFWAAWQSGEFLTDAAWLAGTYRHRGLAWLRESGGVRPAVGKTSSQCRMSFRFRDHGQASGTRTDFAVWKQE